MLKKNLKNTVVEGGILNELCRNKLGLLGKD